MHIIIHTSLPMFKPFKYQKNKLLGILLPSLVHSGYNLYMTSVQIYIYGWVGVHWDVTMSFGFLFEVRQFFEICYLLFLFLWELRFDCHFLFVEIWDCDIFFFEILILNDYIIIFFFIRWNDEIFIFWDDEIITPTPTQARPTYMADK